MSARERRKETKVRGAMIIWLRVSWWLGTGYRDRGRRLCDIDREGTWEHIPLIPNPVPLALQAPPLEPSSQYLVKRLPSSRVVV
jgi:hypothetical protein